MLSFNQKGFAHALLLIILLVGLAVGVYLVQQRTNFLPKAFNPLSGPISGPIGKETPKPGLAVPSAYFTLTSQHLEVLPGETVAVKLLVSSSVESANLFSAKISYQSSLVDVVKTDDTGSVITQWMQKEANPETNIITITGGVADPGIKTTSDKALLTTIIFKAKKTGKVLLGYDSSSQIFRNSDNANIIDASKNSGTSFEIKEISITPTPTPSVRPTSTPIISPVRSCRIDADCQTGEACRISENGSEARCVALSNRGPAATPGAPPSRSIGPCTVRNVRWDAVSNPLTEGSVVGLYANFNGSCSEEDVNFEVRKSGILGIGDASVISLPAHVSESTGTITGKWIAVYKPEGPFGTINPYYYFTVKVAGSNNVNQSADPKIQVAPNPTKTFPKGDGNHDGKLGLNDVSAALSNMGKKTFPAEIDLNSDGVINVLDVLALKQLMVDNKIIGQTNI